MEPMLRLVDKYRKIECPVCGAQDTWGNGMNGELECVHCQSEKCFKKVNGIGNCELHPAPWGTILECLKSPICFALKAKDPNWRSVPPLGAVHWNPQPVKKGGDK